MIAVEQDHADLRRDLPYFFRAARRSFSLSFIPSRMTASKSSSPRPCSTARRQSGLLPLPAANSSWSCLTCRSSAETRCSNSLTVIVHLVIFISLNCRLLFGRRTTAAVIRSIHGVTQVSNSGFYFCCLRRFACHRSLCSSPARPRDDVQHPFWHGGGRRESLGQAEGVFGSNDQGV